MCIYIYIWIFANLLRARINGAKKDCEAKNVNNSHCRSL